MPPKGKRGPPAESARTKSNTGGKKPSGGKKPVHKDPHTAKGIEGLTSKGKREAWKYHVDRVNKAATSAIAGVEAKARQTDQYNLKAVMLQEQKPTGKGEGTN
jgi:hypothetical protein